MLSNHYWEKIVFPVRVLAGTEQLQGKFTAIPMLGASCSQLCPVAAPGRDWILHWEVHPFLKVQTASVTFQKHHF